LVRSLPTVVSGITNAITEWRLGTEAQRDTAAMMAGKTITPAPGVVNVAGRPAGQPSPVILPAPPAQGGPVPGAPSYEFVESRIVKILNESETADEAASRAVDFLGTIDPGAVAQLAGLGEGGLLNFFASRPQLKPATQNLPRLREFIQSFLKYASEGSGEPVGSEESPPPAVH
jgi:hypothetical protein